MRYKRLRLHIHDTVNNVIPYEIYSMPVGNQRVSKAKRLSVAMKWCTGSLELVADKRRIDRATLFGYENGQVTDENMQINGLIQTVSPSNGIGTEEISRSMRRYIEYS